MGAASHAHRRLLTELLFACPLLVLYISDLHGDNSRRASASSRKCPPYEFLTLSMYMKVDNGGLRYGLAMDFTGFNYSALYIILLWDIFDICLSRKLLGYLVDSGNSYTSLMAFRRQTTSTSTPSYYCQCACAYFGRLWRQT